MTALSRRNFLTSVSAATAAAALPAALQAEPRAQTLPALHPVAEQKMVARPFALTDVRLLPSPFRDAMERNRSFLYSIPNDRLAHNFRVTAGLPSEATPLGGWEAPDCELRGHYVGHYLSATALLHASTGDQPILIKANELVAMLAECQQKNGYLGAYPTTFYDRLRAYKDVWAPFYTYHKILAGLLDMHQLTGNQQALGMALKMADWADAYSQSVIAAGGPDAWQKVLLVEQGGMMESAWNLYGITGDARYRALAIRFEHHKMLDPLAANEDQLSGNHANTNIPKMIGAARGYELTGDPKYAAISENFHRIVTQHHAYCTGGTSNGETWHDPNAIATQLGFSAEECCCSYNMMKLTRQLFARQPDARLFDYYERLLYNVRLGTQDRNGMLQYYVSLKPGLYKTFGDGFDAFYCCTGTGSEEYAKLNDSIYFHDEAAVYVNLFIPSKLTWKERGLTLRQTTDYLKTGRITLTIDQAPASATTLKIRIPYFATTPVAVAINNQPQTIASAPSTYLGLAHSWKAGDVITVEMPLTLHVDTAPDDPQVQAAMYGPLVLAARLGTEDLTAPMIYGSVFREPDNGYPMPTVNTRQGLWFEQVDGSNDYSLQFRTLGHGVTHTLIPLNQILAERYSVYLRVV
jgi:DUF1680 family protein